MKKFMLYVVIVLTVVLSVARPASALYSAPTRTVRVGFYYAEGYHMMDENGSRSGYGYEILQAMKLYNNWVYEYIGYDKGWADIQKMLLEGEIDIVVSAVKTPARMEIYDFSERSIAQSGASLMVKAGESKYVAGAHKGYNGIRIGFIENSSQIASTKAFAAEKGFTFVPVYFKTSAELEEALLLGDQVDAIVTSNMRIIQGARRLEMFAMQDVHVMVQKGDTELLAEVDYALEQISLYNYGLYDTLFDKYYSIDTGDEVFFTPDESRFIQQLLAEGTVLKVSLTPDIQPYAYYEGNTPHGILYDIAIEILRRTGLEYEFIPATTDAEYRRLLVDKHVDLRLAARYDLNYAEKLGYTLINPYYKTDISKVTRKEHEGEIKSIAAVKGSTIEEHYLPTIVTGETMRYYATADDCVDALLRGECDAMYLYTRSAQQAVYEDETNSLVSVIMPQFIVNFTLSVREDADAKLASILEKAAMSISEDEIAALVLKYTDNAIRPITLKGLIYDDPLNMLGIVVLVLIFIFAVVMALYVMNKRKQEIQKNRELKSALESAEQANNAKSIFMSRMSHEIRTPLNAIIGYNSISGSALRSANNESEYRHAAMKAMDCLTKCDIASKQLLTVINDVLDMSAIESGKFKIAHDAFDLKNMMSALTIMFYSQAKSKGVDFAVDLEKPIEEWYVGDSMRVSQILNNLMSNAVKFTPKGGRIMLSVRQQVLSDTQTQINFEVTDTGIGMSEEFMNHMWQPFEQADASISRRFGGTGLGLSITKHLVDIMGGDISVESKLGKGSTFRVNIVFERMEQPENSHTLDLSLERVLVVDDDKSTCDYIKMLFDRAGTRCNAVTSGEEAVAQVQSAIGTQDEYTICVVDWHMPGMDGMTTAKRIRDIAGPEMPIIVISAYDFSEIENSAREVGVNTFIAKPLFQSTIMDLLASLRGRRGLATDTRKMWHNFEGARVLLAEDNQMNMEIAKATLRAWNIEVDEAHNGERAVSMFIEAPEGTYSAILMDVHMPGMDGYRATRIIRASSHPEATTIPILAMTADVFAEDVAEATKAGMNAHIGKPIEKNVLLDALLRYIEHR